jgi:hypothetical protein
LLSARLLAIGVGLYLVGGPERRYPERAGGLRVCLQIAAGISLALAAWVFTLTLQGLNGRWAAGFAVVQAGLLWAYAAHLARRMGSRGLMRVSRWMAILVVIWAISILSLAGSEIWFYRNFISKWVEPVVGVILAGAMVVKLNKSASEAAVNWSIEKAS